MQNTLKVQSWYFGASKCPVFPRPDSKQLFKHFLDTFAPDDMHPGIADGKNVHNNSVRQLLFTACTLLPNRSAGIPSDWVFYDALLVAFLFKSLSFGSTLHDCKYTVNQSHVEARVFLFPRSCFLVFGIGGWKISFRLFEHCLSSLLLDWNHPFRNGSQCNCITSGALIRK